MANDETWVLEKLKEHLRTAKHPGDRERLGKILKLMQKLDLTTSPGERSELRGLLKTAFEIGDTELEAVLPATDGVEYLTNIPRIERPPFPNVGGWVEAYVKATASQESPESFHALALMTCVGAFIGRRIVLDMTFFKVRPNMSVVLTGPAGGPKKTIAWEMAMEMCQSGMRGKHLRIISDASPQALVEELARDQPDAVGMVYAPEFRNFFPSAQYMEGVIPLLTRLLDNPDSYPVARITRKVKAIRNVTLSMAGGSTLDWMAKLPSDAQGGGFLTRVMIVHEEASKQKIALPKRQKTELMARVKQAMLEMEQYGAGEMRMDPAAKKWFAEWYKRRAEGMVPRLVLYYNRKQTHLLRVAMLLRLPGRVILEEDMEKADALMGWIEQPLPDVYRIIGMSKSGEITRAVLDMIRSAGGVMDYSLLMKEMKGLLGEKELRMALDTLKAADQVKEVKTVVEHKLVLKNLGVVE